METQVLVEIQEIQEWVDITDLKCRSVVMLDLQEILLQGALQIREVDQIQEILVLVAVVDLVVVVDLLVVVEQAADLVAAGVVVVMEMQVIGMGRMLEILAEVAAVVLVLLVVAVVDLVERELQHREIQEIQELQETPDPVLNLDLRQTLDRLTLFL